MIPLIDKKETGINLRRIMDKQGLSVKDVQKYLGLASVQSIYHWLNGISVPTVDNLYALSYLFRIPVDQLICGNRPDDIVNQNLALIKRLSIYCEKVSEKLVA